MTINLHLPTPPETLRPTITVVGVGGAGGNAVNNMITSNLEGVNFVVANTDAQALEHSQTERRILLGTASTRGLGAGGKPEMGRISAEESIEELSANIEGSNMVFITAGMGGGTGTGAAPVVARLARELGILTVAVVTKPFSFEGPVRMRQAESGLEELHRYVDTVIVIPNQNLFRVANEKTTFADAFRMADEVLHSGVRGVTDLITMPGLINLDFADIRSVMEQMGKAIMGTGEATGDRRAIEAAEAAISNPLLDDVSMKGAKGVLINITGGYDMTLFEVDEAANRIRAEVDADANIIFGSTFNQSMEGRMRVSVVATGIDGVPIAQTSNAAAAQAQAAAAANSKQAYGAPQQPANRFAPRPVDAPRSSVFDFRATPAAAPATKPRAASAAAVAKADADAMDAESEPAPAAMEPAPRAAVAPTPLEAAAEAAATRNETPAMAEAPRSSAQPGYVSVKANVAETEESAAHPMAISPRKTSGSHAEAPRGGMSLLDRLSSIGRAFGPRADAEMEEEAMEEPQQRRKERKAEVRASSAAMAAPEEETTEEDYIDIPAFLRRQAN